MLLTFKGFVRQKVNRIKIVKKKKKKQKKNEYKTQTRIHSRDMHSVAVIFAITVHPLIYINNNKNKNSSKNSILLEK